MSDDIDITIAKIWPVDFTTLKKGDVINGVTLAHEWGLDLTVVADNETFKLKLLGLSAEIDRQCRIRGLITAIRRGNICILSDKEYAKKQKSLVKAASKKIQRAVTLPAPDLSALTPAEVAEWDSSDRFAQRNAAKLIEAKRETKAIQRALKAGNKRPSLRG